MFGIDCAQPVPTQEHAHQVGVPQTLQELTAIVFDQSTGKVHERFRQGMAAVALVLYPKYDLSPMNSSMANNVLQELIGVKEPMRFACIEQARAFCIAVIDTRVVVENNGKTTEQQINENEKRRIAYRNSLNVLIELAKPLSDTIVARRLIGYARTTQFNPEVPFGEFAVVLRTLGHDSLRLVVPIGSDASLVNAVDDQTQHVWNAIRSPQHNESQILTHIILSGEKHKNVRSFAHHRKNPITVINSHDPNFSAVVRHETVHAVFGAEAGLCVLADINEGFATKIAESFDPVNDKGNSVQSILVSMRRNGMNPRVSSDKIRSHTQLLEESSPHVHIEDPREYSYLYGYCLAKAILTSDRFRSSVKDAAMEGKSPYHLLIELNKILSIDNPHIRSLIQVDPTGATIVAATNRELLAHALWESGFNSDEILEMTSTYLRMVLANQKI